MTEKTWWHIARLNGEGKPALGYKDGREIRVGETLRVEDEPEICEKGLHACRRLFDCLQYAQGTVICKVTLGGKIDDEGDDKVAAQERTVLAMTTAEAGERIVSEFARWCALQVAHLWDMPDAVRQYLETGDESLRDAAWAAVRDAARAAARDAARAAAWDAAWAAVRDAVRDASRAAAWDAAWDAVRDAARAAARDASWAAAWAASRDAFMDKANAHLVALVEAEYAKQSVVSE